MSGKNELLLFLRGELITRIYSLVSLNALILKLHAWNKPSLSCYVKKCRYLACFSSAAAVIKPMDSAERPEITDDFVKKFDWMPRSSGESAFRETFKGVLLSGPKTLQHFSEEMRTGGWNGREGAQQ